MTIVITRDLTGAALDWAVAKAMGHENGFPQGLLGVRVKGFGHERVSWRPSVDWSQGGMLIDREGINVRRGNDLHFPKGNERGEYVEALWLASIGDAQPFHGTTALMAAMRCYVDSKLGEKVEVPDSLTQGDAA